MYMFLKEQVETFLLKVDDHELPGLDIVTCVALIQTNHSKVNMLIYGSGSTIHSSCQIEWFNNIGDDKSHHVGGKQVITFLDGYATPLQCRSGLMYMSILGKPTDQDLDQSLMYSSPSHMNGILLYWIILIQIPMDIPPGPMILLLGTNMTQE